MSLNGKLSIFIILTQISVFNDPAECRLIRTDSKELIAFIIRVTRIGALGTTLAYVPSKRRFLQEPHSVTYQKTAFFIVTAVETSNFT
jgi:hypothetical protein